MNRFFLPTIAVVAALAVPIYAGKDKDKDKNKNGMNGTQQPAAFSSTDSGSCTMQLVVGGTTDVVLREGNAVLRDVAVSQPSQIRKIECTGRMPTSAALLTVQQVEGRGTVQMLPQSGETTVIRIVDQGAATTAQGPQPYTIRILWGNGGAMAPAAAVATVVQQQPATVATVVQQQAMYPQSAYVVTAASERTPHLIAQAIRRCGDGVRRTAGQRYGTRQVLFTNVQVQDAPDNRDMVVGTITLRDQPAPHTFACSTDFSTGEVRWTQIDLPPGTQLQLTPAAAPAPVFAPTPVAAPAPAAVPAPAPAGVRRIGTAERMALPANGAAVENCRREISAKLAQSGMSNLDFTTISLDPARSDYFVGDVQFSQPGAAGVYNFSCQVNPDTGGVRSVILTPR